MKYKIKNTFKYEDDSKIKEIFNEIFARIIFNSENIFPDTFEQ